MRSSWRWREGAMWARTSALGLAGGVAFFIVVDLFFEDFFDECGKRDVEFIGREHEPGLEVLVYPARDGPFVLVALVRHGYMVPECIHH